MGVPILRGGRVLGVLVVQNRTLRHYTEDEIEALQTIAMVVAELVASGELVNPLEMAPEPTASASLPMRLDGVRLNAGLAHRRRRCCTSRASSSARSSPRIRRPSWSACASAVAAMQQRDRRAARRRATSSAAASIATSSRPIACSPPTAAGSQRIAEAVRSGLTAEAAVQKVAGRHARAHEQVERSLSARAAARSRGPRQPPAAASRRAAARPQPRPSCPTEFILVARSMGPAELLDYDRRRLKALVLEEGSPTAHVAIVARALDIPVVGRVEDVLSRGRGRRHRRRRRRRRRRC